MGVYSKAKIRIATVHVVRVWESTCQSSKSLNMGECSQWFSHRVSLFLRLQPMSLPSPLTVVYYGFLFFRQNSLWFQKFEIQKGRKTKKREKREKEMCILLYVCVCSMHMHMNSTHTQTLHVYYMLYTVTVTTSGLLLNFHVCIIHISLSTCTTTSNVSLLLFCPFAFTANIVASPLHTF